MTSSLSCASFHALPSLPQKFISILPHSLPQEPESLITDFDFILFCGDDLPEGRIEHGKSCEDCDGLGTGVVRIQREPRTILEFLLSFDLFCQQIHVADEGLIVGLFCGLLLVFLDYFARSLRHRH